MLISPPNMPDPRFRKTVVYIWRHDVSGAAVAVGVAGVFMEVHDDPDNAASDGPNNLHLYDLESLLIKLKKFDQISK